MDLKRVIGAVLCAALLLCACVGCSTPSVAMTVDGVSYSTGEYLANLYSTYQAMYQNYLYMYVNYKMDPWAQSFDYTGLDGETQSLGTADYIKQVTQENLIRQRAVVKLMEQYGIALSDDDLKELDEAMASASESQLLRYGFNKDSYKKMLTATGYNEQALFFGLYDEDGKQAVSESDLRAYFDENYLLYKSVETSLADSEGNDLSEADIAAIRASMEKYLAIYEESGNFDKAIAQYNADSDTTEDTTDTETDTDTDMETDAEPEVTVVEPTEIVADRYDDEAFVTALKSVEEGKAQIVTYKKNGETNTMALILRMDPEGEGRETSFTDNHDSILQSMKWDDYNDMVEELAKTLPVDVNKRAVNMCDPKSFYEIDNA